LSKGRIKALENVSWSMRRGQKTQQTVDSCAQANIGDGGECGGPPLMTADTLRKKASTLRAKPSMFGSIVASTQGLKKDLGRKAWPRPSNGGSRLGAQPLKICTAEQRRRVGEEWPQYVEVIKLKTRLRPCAARSGTDRGRYVALPGCSPEQ
jgi:hypothetical protein